MEIGDIFAFLGQLASDAAADKECPEAVHRQSYLAPIPARGMGFAAGRTPEETLLVMRLSGLDLAFAVPSSGLAALADDIARIARTLSADPAQPQ